MPRGVVDDDAFLRIHVVNLLDDGVRLVGDLLVQLAPILVVAVDVFAELLGRLHVAREEQVDGLLAVHHASGGVDAWADLEDDVADQDVLAGESADVDDALEAEAGVVVQLA